MEMSIGEAIKEVESITIVTDEKQALAFALAVHTMKKYQMMQADYNARLKADMVAILVELQLVIEGKRKDTVVDGYDSGYNTGIFVSTKTIQDEINALKGENT